MKKLPLLRFFLIAVLLSSAACSLSSDPDLYVLAPTASSASGAAVVAPTATYTIKILRPFLAHYLDRRDIVMQSTPYQVEVDQTRNWAEPLDLMFERILAEDLRQRLPHSTVITESDNSSIATRFTIETSIEKFNVTANGEASLLATLNIIDKAVHQQPPQQYAQFDSAPGTSQASLTAGLSGLVGRTADMIVNVLQDEDRIMAAENTSNQQ